MHFYTAQMWSVVTVSNVVTQSQVGRSPKHKLSCPKPTCALRAEDRVGLPVSKAEFCTPRDKPKNLVPEIEKIFHFSLPVAGRVPVSFWDLLQEWDRLHPISEGWEYRLWQDPIAAEYFPITSTTWKDCVCPVQVSGLMRLEAVYHYGGFYVDMDVVPMRKFDVLLNNSCVFCLQDEPFFYTPDCIFGATKYNPLIRVAIDRALSMDMKAGPLATGPANLTAVVDEFRLRHGWDWNGGWTVLPSKTFFPYSYTEKHREQEDFSQDKEVLCRHLWQHSWKGF